MSRRLDLSQVDVVEFLTKLGVQIGEVGQEEVRFHCPYPAHEFGDRHPSAYINRHTTAWTCFSCGASGNAITFLADVADVPRSTARRWIIEAWMPDASEIEDLADWVRSYFAQGDRQTDERKPIAYLDERYYLDRAVDWHDPEPTPWKAYMFGRGFTPDILSFYEVGYDPISNRPCITVRDPNGKLVGFKGRAMDDSHPKYMVLGDTPSSLQYFGERYGFAPYDAKRHVFGLDKAEIVDDTLIVIEGELNVIAARQKGLPNVCGPSGSTFSDEQVEQITDACSRVVLLMDSDIEDPMSAATARSKVLAAIDQFGHYVDVWVVPEHEGDPAEMNASDLHALVDEAMNSLTYRLKMRLA